jgi:hypothetical protein
MIRIKNLIRYYWHWISWGFRPSDLWNMDVAVSKFMEKRLAKFRTHCHGVPGNLDEEEWDLILSKMQMAFHYIATWDVWDDKTGKDRAVVHEGLDLYRKWFFALWD